MVPCWPDLFEAAMRELDAHDPGVPIPIGMELADGPGDGEELTAVQVSLDEAPEGDEVDAPATAHRTDLDNER
jgi:hypothetical protein